MFYYTSQLKIWIGLYPLVIIKILINEYNYLQAINSNFKLQRPHENPLLYEKQKFISFEKIIILFNSFLN